MRHEFRAVIPLAPSVNDSLRPEQVRIRVAGRVKAVARLVKTREAKVFEKACRAAVAPLVRGKALWSGVLELYLTVYVPALDSDGGNRVKLTEDALQQLVFRDDLQIVEWHIIKRIDAARPRAEVVIRHADPQEHLEVARRLAVSEQRAARESRKPVRSLGLSLLSRRR